MTDGNEPGSDADGVPAHVWRHPAVVLATGFWIGRLGRAPGTLGTLLGLPLALLIARIGNPWLQIGVIVGISLACVPICTMAARRLAGAKDPQVIVLDELASLPITFALLWHEAYESISVIIMGFGLFRLFDITKPPPARQFERLPEGWGIMADDWAAAVYSWIALHAMLLTGVV